METVPVGTWAQNKRVGPKRKKMKIKKMLFVSVGGGTWRWKHWEKHMSFCLIYIMRSSGDMKWNKMKRNGSWVTEWLNCHHQLSASAWRWSWRWWLWRWKWYILTKNNGLLLLFALSFINLSVSAIPIFSVFHHQLKFN